MMADKEIRLIDANALMQRICGKECGQHFKKCDLEEDNPDTRCVFREYVQSEPAVEAITREEFIRNAKELITAFVGSGEKTEENRIIFALVFGNLELRLFGSRDGDSDD